MRLKIATILLVCVTSFAFSFQDQSSSSTSDKEFRPVSVAAFKNGLAFVIRNGNVKVEDGKGQIDHVPASTLGTLWIATNAPAVLEEVVAFRHKEPRVRSVASLSDLIQANVGKTVTVTYNNKEYTGEVLGWGVSPDELKTEPVDEQSSEDQRPQVTPAVKPVLLRISGKVMALNHSSISGVEVAGDPSLTWSPLVEQKSLRFRIKNASGSVPLSMEYLEKGLGWSPSYLIELKDKNTAQLTMQAVLINDAENLEHTDVFFVVGFPNFKYSEVHSPMALQESLAKLMTSINGTLGRLQGNALANQSNDSYGFTVSGMTENFWLQRAETPELAGDSEEDLFLYSRPDVTLKTGERALYNVFSSLVSYDEVYDWEVSDNSRVDESGNYQEQSSKATRKSHETVWHSLRLKNNSKFPWTTAPALVVHGTNPISQELLSYTPKAASGYLKLTIASDIHADRDENEITRVKGATRITGTTYDAVTAEGTLRVHNYKTTAATLHVVKDVVGEVLSASNGGKSHKTTKEIEAVNPHSTIEWEIPVKAGEEIELKYRYKIFVHSGPVKNPE